MTTTYRRLIAMRECLRQAQLRLPVVPTDTGYKEDLGYYRSEFICNMIDSTSCGDEASRDVKNLIHRAISPHITFNDWLKSTTGSEFGFQKRMQLRQQWINQLCRAINVQIEMERPMKIVTETVTDHPNRRHWRKA